MRFKRVLIFCAHPDDEVLGLGGTIAKLSDEGSKVKVVIFTLGGTTQTTNLTEGMKKVRTDEAYGCDKILGIKEREIFGIPAQEVMSSKKLYRACIKLIRQYKPDVIFSHYYKDKHRDHRVISELVDEARWKASENTVRELGNVWYTSYLYYFEIQDLFTSPSIIVDISETLPRKIEAMQVHKSQIDMYPNICGYIEGLAKARGFLANTNYGEAFLLSNRFPTLWR